MSLSLLPHRSSRPVVTREQLHPWGVNGLRNGRNGKGRHTFPFAMLMSRSRILIVSVPSVLDPILSMRASITNCWVAFLPPILSYPVHILKGPSRIALAISGFVLYNTSSQSLTQETSIMCSATQGALSTKTNNMLLFLFTAERKSGGGAKKPTLCHFYLLRGECLAVNNTQSGVPWHKRLYRRVFLA